MCFHSEDKTRASSSYMIHVNVTIPEYELEISHLAALWLDNNKGSKKNVLPNAH